MAKKKQIIPDGTKVKFIKYAEGMPEGDLEAGAMLTVTGYDPEEDLYNVEGKDGIEDSLDSEEFEVLKEKPKAEEKSAEDLESEAEVLEDEAKVLEEEADELLESVVPKFKKTASITAALKEHKGDALDAAYDYAERKEKTVWVLGGILAFIKRNNLHSEVVEENDEGIEVPVYGSDLTGFNQYVKDELGLAPRTADYYVNIYECFSQITTESAIAKVGWTKLSELIPLKEHLTKDNVGDWLKKAKDHTAVELHDYVTEELVSNDTEGSVHGSRQTAKVETFHLAAPEDMATNWRKAFDTAREVIGAEATESACMDHIITEWIAVHNAPEEG